MTALHEPADRDDSAVRFARAIHRFGLRHADGWLDAGFRGLSQATIADRIQLSRPTVSGLVQDASSLLVETRSGVLLDASKAGFAVGIDIGQAHHRVALADIHGQLFKALRPKRYEAPGGDDPASVTLDWAVKSVGELLEEAKVDADRIWAVGVSLPGPVNQTTRRLQTAPQRMDRSWEIVDIRLPMVLGLPAPIVESDYNASALTEHLWGASRERNDALYVKVGRRCACSLLIDHKIYRGSDGLAGRLGKTVVMDADGKTQHWELVEDVFSLRAMQIGKYGGMTASKLVELSKTDSALRRTMQRGARALGVALAPIIDALNPEVVVIGGALGTASLAWIASDLLDGINWLGESPQRASISQRLIAGAFPSATAIRGAMASALLADAPARIAAVMAG